MNIQPKSSYFIGLNPNNPLSQSQKNGNNLSYRKSPFADGTNPMENASDSKRAYAQKRANRLKSNALSSNQDLNNQIEKHTNKRTSLEEKLKFIEDTKKNRELDKERLREAYDVDPDSQEQKDLDLLLRKFKSGTNKSSYTEEEYDRLLELEGKELTKYQSRMLKMEPSAKELLLELKQEFDVRKELRIEKNTVEVLTNMLQVSDVMVNAQKGADQIIEASIKESIGLLINDAKTAIEEDLKEKEEEAEKIQEEKDEEEKLIENSKDKNLLDVNKKAIPTLDSEKIIEEASQGVDDKLQTLLDKIKEIEATIKGTLNVEYSDLIPDTSNFKGMVVNSNA